MFHTQHLPVLLEEALSSLELSPGKLVVDATLGGGTATRTLLERVLPGGKVFAFDWDKEALDRFTEASRKDTLLKTALEKGELVLIPESFATLEESLLSFGIEKVDAIFADLGLSSDQLADKEKGLSFLEDGPLDMRLNSKETVTAATLLSTFSENQLTDLFRTYGDEQEARKIAHTIVKARQIQSLTRTKELAELIRKTVSMKRRFGRIHPATKVFQALRMAVNSERVHLEGFLPQAEKTLKPGGRLAIITFHSGEDALVKHFFQKEARGCICGLVPCICGRKKTLSLVSKKPILPTPHEVEKNPRSRSAKLRVVEKLG